MKPTSPGNTFATGLWHAFRHKEEAKVLPLLLLGPVSFPPPEQKTKPPFPTSPRTPLPSGKTRLPPLRPNAASLHRKTRGMPPTSFPQQALKTKPTSPPNPDFAPSPLRHTQQDAWLFLTAFCLANETNLAPKPRLRPLSTSMNATKRLSLFDRVLLG
jgi:hypothetical protein